MNIRTISVAIFIGVAIAFLFLAIGLNNSTQKPNPKKDFCDNLGALRRAKNWPEYCKQMGLSKDCMTPLGPRDASGNLIDNDFGCSQ